MCLTGTQVAYFGVGALGELQNSYANMQRQTEGGDQELGLGAI